MQELKFRRCCGCGRPSHQCNSLTAIIADIYLCEECILICVSIIANQAQKELRIHFLDELQKIIKEPIEIVTKWKEVESMKAEMVGK